jgi:hypothetical protein
MAGGILSPLIFWGSDRLLINSWEDDYLITLNEDHLLEKALIWKLGSLKMPFTAASDYNRYKREKQKYVRDVMAYETPSRWLISFYYQSGQTFGLVSRADGAVILASNPAADALGIVNNLDGGPPFWPDMNISGPGYLYQVTPAIAFLDWFNTPSARPAEIQQPGAAEKLKLLVSQLKPSDNPVIIRVKAR